MFTLSFPHSHADQEKHLAVSDRLTTGTKRLQVIFDPFPLVSIDTAVTAAQNSPKAAQRQACIILRDSARRLYAESIT
jgi:hypothetical protein